MIRKLFIRLSGLVCLIITTVAANAESIPIWSRWDHSLTASDAASPETEFAVKFTSPTKRTLIVTGFWDGGTTWRVRFMPDEAGNGRTKPVLFHVCLAWTAKPAESPAGAK